MLNYRIASNVAPVDLVSSLTSVRVVKADGSVGHPVDLVLVKLTDDSILVSTHERGHAVIHRKPNEKGKWEYKYTVVENLQPTADGGIVYQEVASPQTDPLGLIEHLHPRLLAYYHDESSWLRLTATCNYPDCIVALSRHMLWQENLSEQEIEHAPDLVVTARPGWFFGTEATAGTTHGYPFRDSMRASFFVSGPNVRRAAQIEEPCRLVDLTPTMLDMLGFRMDTGDFDGHPLRNIYEPAATAQASASGTQTQQVKHSDADAPETRPVYWDDVDLKAWNKLPYNARPAYEHLPWTIHHPYKPYDIHNIAYDILAISDFNVLRIVDDVLYPVANGRPYVTEAAEWVEAKLRASQIPALSNATDALSVSTTTIGDYSFTSAGNMKRIDGTIDWTQNRARAIDKRIARRWGREETPGTAAVNKVIDRVRWWFWEGYRFGERIIAECSTSNCSTRSKRGPTRRSINSVCSRRRSSSIRLTFPRLSRRPLSDGRENSGFLRASL